jgi:hypothetical protein
MQSQNFIKYQEALQNKIILHENEDSAEDMGQFLHN